MLAHRRFAVILVVNALAFLSFNMYLAVFPNFTAQELNLDPGAYGLLEGIREVPGLLLFLLAAVTTAFSQERIFVACLWLIGLGIGAYAFSQNLTHLILATLVQSVGFHLWHVVQDAMVIKDAGADRALRLGRLNGISSAATLAGSLAVALLHRWVDLRHFFLIAALAGVAAAVVGGLALPRDQSAPRRRRFVFRWAYRSYYILSLFSGARRHMVLTFAAFALVRLYGTPVQTMALLFAAHTVLSTVLRPLIGRFIHRVGERRALFYSYGALVLIFMGYAWIREPWVAYGLFILDHVLTGFDIAIASHAGQIVPEAELGPSLATGSTINHIFGVAVPALGGWLWDSFGAQVPFLLGAALAAIASLYAWQLTRRPAIRATPGAA